MWSVLVCLQELRGRVSHCCPLRSLVGRLRADVGQLEALREELQRLNDSLSILQERFTLHHYQQLLQRQFILQQHLHSCSSQLGTTHHSSINIISIGIINASSSSAAASSASSQHHQQQQQHQNHHSIIIISSSISIGISIRIITEASA